MRESSRRSFLRTVPAAAGVAGLGLAAASLSPGSAGATGVTGAAGDKWQSPINVRFNRLVRDPKLPALRVRYSTSADLHVRYVSRDQDDPTGCASRNREETVEAGVPAGSSAVYLGDTRYELLQFHFHTPSEHQVDGRRAPLEQHLVHQGPDGQKLVIGRFLLGGGRGDTVQDQVLRELPEECGREVDIRGANLASMLPRDLTTVRYQGSLTTDPYTGNVSWLLLAVPGRVSTDDLHAFQDLFPEGDSREPQPLNGRVVSLRVQHR